MRLFITSSSPAAVQITGERFFRIGTDKSVFEFDREALFGGCETESGSVTALLVLTPISLSGLEPICAELRFFPDGNDISIKAECSLIQAVDWSLEDENSVEHECVYELIPEYMQSERMLEAKQLDKLELERSGEKTEIELYRDCGLRLSIRENGEERGFILGSGEDGGLRALDAGFARFVAVHLKGCTNLSALDSDPIGGERLMLFNESFELAGGISGDHIYIEDGCLIAINELGTVLSHQQRLKYEISADGLRMVGGASASAAEEAAVGEIGYFTHQKRRAKTDEETALALMECVLLGREDEAMALLSPALSDGLDLDGLFEFFGDFDEARKAPFCEKNSPPIIGAVRESRAKAYVFEFENGLINDISELEPPASRHSQEDGTAEAE